MINTWFTYITMRFFGGWNFFVTRDGVHYWWSDCVTTAGGVSTPLLLDKEEWYQYVIVRVIGGAGGYIVYRPRVWWWPFSRWVWLNLNFVYGNTTVRLGVGRDPADFAFVTNWGNCSTPTIEVLVEYGVRRGSNGHDAYFDLRGNPIAPPKYNMHL